MRKSRKILLISAIIYVLAMVAIYMGVSVYFMKHFFPNSVINGIDCSSKTVEEAENLIANKVQNYSISIKQKDGREDTISGARMDFKFVSNGEVKALKDSQNPLTWISAYFNPQSYSMVAKTTYNKDSLKKSLEALECFDETLITKPQDAKIIEAGTGYQIQSEIEGNELDKEKAFNLLVEAVDKGDKSVDFAEGDCYIKPAVYANDENLTTKLDILNKYSNMTITYDVLENQEVINSQTINEWLKLEDDNNITFDTEAVNAYVDNLKEKYDTIGRSVSFHTSLGEEVSVECVTNGWMINGEQEKSELMEVLKAGESVERSPVYSASSMSSSANGIGDTYVEIDYTSQHMWYYKNGALVIDTDVVTGNPNKGNASPIGIFNLVGKERNATLVGEDYRTPVSYWMPYYEGVGIHDADWQPVFGGNRYMTFGSHGCINTPINIVSVIYDNIEVGTPIVCYQGTILPNPPPVTPETEPGTESNKETNDTNTGTAETNADGTPVTPTDNTAGTTPDVTTPDITTPEIPAPE